MGEKINEKLLEEKLVELEGIRSWSPRVLSKLENMIRTGDEFSLFRINPLRFGIEKNIPEGEAIDLFLYAAKLELFQMNWHFVCPTCGDPVDSFRTLATVHTHSFYCSLCHTDYEATLDDYIQISFTVLPQIREIVFHHPESLSVEDYYYKYHFSRGARIPGGPEFVQAIPRMTRILSYLAPGEKKSFETEISPNMLSGIDLINNAGFVYTVNGSAKPENKTLSIKLSGRKFEPDHLNLSPGKMVFEFENLTQKKGSIMMLNMAPGYKTQHLQFEQFLSGKKLLTTQTFRDLFRSEVFQGTEGIGVKEITILFTDLKGSTALYDRIGDLNAFSLVRQHFDYLGKVINRNSGAIVKTIGDAVMASFLNPVDAVKSALEILREIEQFNKGMKDKEIILKIGIHVGASIAVTLNDRLDYFGQTVNIASRVQGLANAEEIFITRDVFIYPGVQKLLRGIRLFSNKAKLRGVEEEMQVIKISYKDKITTPG